jgi:hypothetical protein
MTTPCRFVSPSGIIAAKVLAGCDGEATVKEIRRSLCVTVCLTRMGLKRGFCGVVTEACPTRSEAMRGCYTSATVAGNAFVEINDLQTGGFESRTNRLDECGPLASINASPSPGLPSTHRVRATPRKVTRCRRGCVNIAKS